MSVIRIRDKNGNIIDIPAIKGNDYILTETDKEDIANKTVDLIQQAECIPLGNAENKLAQLISGTLTEITAGDLEGTTKLRNYAFRNYTALTKLGIPNSVKEFEEYAVEGCPADVYYEGEPWEWCYIKRQRYGSQNFKNIYANGKLIEHLELTSDNAMPSPNVNWNISVVNINDRAFQNCTSLKSVKILGADVPYDLRRYAFSGCTNLTSVYIGNDRFGTNTPSSDKYFDSSVFGNCTNLTDIYVCWAEGAIGNAPWGATNATIHYNTPIQFFIDDKLYSAAFRMTWREWCNSEYNTDGFYIDENDFSYVKSADGRIVENALESVGHPAYATSRIYSYKYRLREA